ncbi:MAG: hypothetical protein H6908_01040 [Hyphomicrobiales bacterium]|nr:hypothetical protein [Rickettsiales bacterium]MCP5361217.1 hypothetical protein [Hyphomicrobiales bacterium]
MGKTKISWKDWNPGLNNDDQTLRDVYTSLPGVGAQEVSMLVRLFENPASPIAFKGAVTLERHDCIHVLIGRGLLPQDEAFVIGFTMGTSKAVSAVEAAVFKLVTKYVYPKYYRFTDHELEVYEMGLQRGHECRVEHIYDFPFEDYMDWKLGDLRALIGVNKPRFIEAYQKEKSLLPDTPASKRLLAY